MTAKFEMDAEGTRDGLCSAGLTAESDLTSDVPAALPMGNYTAPYSVAAAALLSKLTAEAEAAVSFGLVTSASSVTATETTESGNAGQLTS